MEVTRYLKLPEKYDAGKGVKNKDKPLKISIN